MNPKPTHVWGHLKRSVGLCLTVVGLVEPVAFIGYGVFLFLWGFHWTGVFCLAVGGWATFHAARYALYLWGRRRRRAGG